MTDAPPILADAIRLPDWEDRLSAYLGSTLSLPFAWGQHDCLLFAGGAVEAVTGIDLTAQHRGRYASRNAARRHLWAMGHRGVRACISAVLQPCVPAQARRGDILMADGMAGVCIGADGLFIGRDETADGLIRVPTLDCSRGWRVG